MRSNSPFYVCAINVLMTHTKRRCGWSAPTAIACLKQKKIWTILFLLLIRSKHEFRGKFFFWYFRKMLYKCNFWVWLLFFVLKRLISTNWHTVSTNKNRLRCFGSKIGQNAQRRALLWLNWYTRTRLMWSLWTSPTKDNNNWLFLYCKL